MVYVLSDQSVSLKVFLKICKESIRYFINRLRQMEGYDFNKFLLVLV